jgi:hypothetical protein
MEEASSSFNLFDSASLANLVNPVNPVYALRIPYRFLIAPSQIHLKEV